MSTTERHVGCLREIRRYPVKSMQGEQLQTGVLTNRGLLGDRVYALIDAKDGTVVSAKNPRKWPGMFYLSAKYTESSRTTGEAAPICVTGPDDLAITSDQSDRDSRLSSYLGRSVRLTTTASSRQMIEQFHPKLDEGDADKVTLEQLPAGTFFDLAPLHLLSAGTMEQLKSLAPDSVFDVRRFRPNLILDLTAKGDREGSWVGRTVRIGGVRVRITQPCGRCVMPTLPQEGLPEDKTILRTIVKHLSSNVGVYATIEQEGEIRIGDEIWVD